MDNETEIYQKLRIHLDNLPGGYPATESGIEMRILRRLFTPEEAALAPYLTLLPEPVRVVALRCGLPAEEVGPRLEQMALKGLIYRDSRPGREPEYSATQFVVGIWEFQVGRLDAELSREMEEYAKEFFDLDLWRRAPQLRTIPVGESIPVQREVMAYEQAGEIIRKQSKIIVAPCICRKEQRLLGEGCDKPLETCLVFGGGAYYYEQNGLGREISVDEALGILEIADRAGLVLQPTNAQEPSGICCCCGDCCGVLRQVKRHPQPASLVSSPFFAVVDEAICAGCSDCEPRCQMEAIRVWEDGVSHVDLARCIGCGLCVTTCSTGALSLQRKPAEQQTSVPRTYVEAVIQLGRERGKLGLRDMAKLVVQSKADRLRAMGQ